MKICRKQKLLFIHIPKCGGSSVTQAFNMESPPDSPHVGIQSVTDQFPEMARDYLKFTIIRNPWEAEVSNFFYKLSGEVIKARGGNEHVEAANTGFSGMLKSKLGITCFRPKLIHSHEYGRSMMRFLTDENDNIAVDEILRLETIDKDMKDMCEKYNLNFAYNREFKQINWTNHLHYSRYYTEQWMIDYVYEKNKDYIEEFGYEFKEQFY